MTSLPPVQARRAARLKAALTEFDNNIAEMARVVDTPRPHLSALIHGSKGCGNELASKTEIEQIPDAVVIRDFGGRGALKALDQVMHGRRGLAQWRS